ncbi:hypothetical protein BP5796_06010 [Coleophoma crateriformis]|uniref:C2H2-type domain-containing protein n=1 Tax=Coleophoma crateriformis TaxID=565419 RepID=A0A3D8RVY8_9HELO|nr:hypothetical protein BP5796_06010 [Coleophoma crateriformis]
MTMAIDNQQRFGAVNFDHMPYTSTPQFTDPWNAQHHQSSAPASHSLYTSHSHGLASHGLNPNLGLDSIAKQSANRLGNNVSMASYSSVPAQAGSSLSSVDLYGNEILTQQQDLLHPNQRIHSLSPSGYNPDVHYTRAPSPSYIPTSTPYESIGYAPAPVRSTYAVPQPQDSRRLSQSSVSSSAFDLSAEVHQQQRNPLIDLSDRALADSARSFGDAIDASRGMIAMSQNTTPRNIYGRQGRGSGDSYGFPTTHSTSSSISSSGTYPSYFGGSVDSSVSDYSNAGSDIESVSSRTLPRPSGLINNGIPPAPQSMMGQFSSKVSSSTQKKHKCKVCDKRFTRPSSLQTHMYSHTGEKPFSCEVEGCGRHFSVVSNLRRHRKVHKGEAQSEGGSPDHQSD